MSNLSDLLPAGAGAKVATFTASGTLPTGQPIILNSDGTVSVVGIESVSGFGTAAQFEGASIGESSVAYDATTAVVVAAYKDIGNSNYGTAVVGTVSGQTITWGTPEVFLTNNVGSQVLVACGNGQAVIAFSDGGNSNYCTAIAGTTSAGYTTITFGTKVVINSDGSLIEGDIMYIEPNPGNETYRHRFVLAFSQGGGRGILALMSAASGAITSGGNNEINGSAIAGHLAIAWDGSAAAGNKEMICVWRTYTPSAPMYYLRFGYTAGEPGSLSLGSASDSGIEDTQNHGVAYDSSQSKYIVAYRSNTDNDLEVAVGTVSGSESMTFGTPATVSGITISEKVQAAYDPTQQAVAVLFRDSDGSPDGLQICYVTTSGTTPTIGSRTDISSSQTLYGDVAYVSGASAPIVTYREGSTGKAAIFGGSASNASSFVGITNQAIANSASGEVVVPGGVITNSSLVAETYTTSVGTEAEISGTRGYYHQPIFDSTNNKIVTVYSDDASSPQYKGMAAVGTVSGTNISYGTPVAFNDAITYFIAGCFDSNAGKVVILFRDQTDNEDTKAIVGTVSGTSISFGSEATITTNSMSDASIVFDSNENKVVAFYKDTAASDYGYAAVGTVSGTSISFGTPVAYQSSQVGMMQDASCFDSSNNKVVIAFRDVDNSGSAAAKVGTISGTSISFGSKATIYSGQTENIVSCFDTTNNKVVVAYRENTAPKYLESAVGTVSGTSISFGTATQIASISASISDPAIEFSPDAGRVLLAYTDNDNSSHGTYAVGVVSGTSITYETPVAWCDSAPAERSGLCYDTYNNVFVISFEDGGDSNKGKSAVITMTGSSALTVGSVYYVQDDGTLSTTATSVTAGKALSATTLLLTG